MHFILTLDVALVAADVVIQLDGSTHYSFPYENTAARFIASLLELHASGAWFRADKQ